MKKITRLFLLIAAFVAWGNVANATNTACAGTSTEASQLSFTLGYNYTFSTSGTDVTVSFELLDTQVGLVASAWTYSPSFKETALSNVSGQVYSHTFSDQNIGSTFQVACKFAWAGGMAVTKIFSYTVGDACGASTDTQAPTAFTATKGSVGINSVELLLNATDDSGAVSYSVSYGATPTVKTTSSASGTQKSFTITGLSELTAYDFSVTAKDAAGNIAANSPIVINATTTSSPAPTASAPTPPTLSAAKVISIFSDAYDSLPGTKYNPDWKQSTAVSTIQIGADNILKYANLNYQGTDFSDVNAVAMNYLHVDVWSPNETSLQIFCISHSTGEKSVQLSPLNLNVWNSYNIPLADFKNQGLSVADLFQFKVVGAGGNTVYLDNMYFYDNTSTVDTQAPTAFTATAGTIASDAVELLLNATDNSGAISYTISYGSTPTVVTASGVSETQKSVIISGLAASTAYTFSVTAKDATGNAAANSPISVLATTLASLPGAPVPTKPVANVISIYSDTYTSLTGTNFSPGWGGSSPISEVSLDGNTAKKYTSFTFQGITYAPPINLTDMTNLHVDIYPTTQTNIYFTPINTSATGTKEKATSLGALIANQWNSIDVPLSTYGIDLSAVDQSKFSTEGGATGGTFYMDNLYFWKVGTGINNINEMPIINCYPNPAIENLSISAQSEICEVKISNLVGQTVKTIIINSLSKTIDISDVSAGNYLVSARMANGQVAIRKIVKL